MSERLNLELKGGSMQVRLRRATMADKLTLDLWDEDPDVKFATNDDHASEDWLEGEDYWTHELGMQSDVYEYFIGEVCDGEASSEEWRPIGAMQVIDPHREPTRYWGEIQPNLRALDIWIGAAADRGKGLGWIMMTQAIESCFADPTVTAIIIDPLNINTRAHKFYRRLGFEPTHRQTFNNGEDDCLIHKLTRREWETRQ